VSVSLRSTAVENNNLSSAFDTVHRQILLNILERGFAITTTTDAALGWFHSYLSDRSYTVHNHWEYIERRCTGLCSASGLGASFQDVHSHYIEDTDSIFTQRTVHHHAFAGDIQTYLAVT